MSHPVQAKQGVAFVDSFVYQLSTGAFQTGKVQANFTIRLSKNGTGNMSTSGITITEVDAVNNPGDYVVSIAATSFVTAIGEWNLVIYDTAAPYYSWQAILQVTALGQVGSLSPVPFTATVGNGRAVDGGGIALSGVTVYVITGSSYYTVLTTDASGLFSFYAEPGTYTLRYEKAGYSMGTATVTFTTVISTGPLADVTLSAVSATSGYTLGTLQAYARQQAYDETGTQADAKLIRACNNATDMVARDTMSNWWLRRDFFSFYGALNFTCTITKGSAVVTSTSGNFPAAWAASSRLKIGSQTVDIIANPTVTTLTMKEAWNDTSASYACVLFQDSYVLPTNCFQFGRILPGQSWGWGGEPVTAERLWEAQNASNFGQTYPSAFAVAYSKLLVFPYPVNDKTVAYTFHARPTPMASTSDPGDFDPAQISLIYSAINAMVAIEFGKALSGSPSETMAQYRDNLGRSVSTDRTPADLPSLGRSGFPSARDLPMWKTYRSP